MTGCQNQTGSLEHLTDRCVVLFCDFCPWAACVRAVKPKTIRGRFLLWRLDTITGRMKFGFFPFAYCLLIGNHQAGAQPHLLNALSARLAKYEAAEAADAMANARPSTRGKAQRFA